MVSKGFATVILLVAVLGLVSNAFARVFEAERESFRFGDRGDFHRHGDFGFRRDEFGFRRGDFGSRRDDFGFRRGDFGSRRNSFANGFELGALSATNRLGGGFGLGGTAVIPGAAVVVPGATVIGSAPGVLVGGSGVIFA